MLLELPHVAAPEHVREKRKTEQTLAMWRFVEDGSSYLRYIVVVLFLCVCVCVCVEVTDPSSSRWHTGKRLFVVCVENSIKFDSAGLHSWLLSAGLEKVLNLHALIWLNWNSSPPTRLCSLTVTLACSLHGQAGELKVIHTGTLQKVFFFWWVFSFQNKW